MRLTELLAELDDWSPTDSTCRGVGCNGCCRIGVLSTEAEAEQVAEVLTEAQWQRVEVADAYRAVAPCPLLEKDGSCGVYRTRPIICRAYRATTPPEACAPGSEGELHSLIYASPRMLEYRAVVVEQGRRTLVDWLQVFRRRTRSTP